MITIALPFSPLLTRRASLWRTWLHLGRTIYII
jgi:hypothetical protein